MKCTWNHANKRNVEFFLVTGGEGGAGRRKDILAIFIMMEITVTVFSKRLENVLRLSSNI